MVDVIVTVFGGRESSRAVRDGGGLVGMRSAAKPPRGNVAISFVDWPFEVDRERPDGFPIEEHVDVVREHRPQYAVAPDVEPPRSLDEVLDVAERLEAFAETVIVVPKTVDPSAVPDRYRVGLPFRKSFETDVWREHQRSIRDFKDVGAVHILGGNPNAQLRIRQEFGIEVASVDTPLILVWADKGRVFIGGGAGGVEVDDLEVRPRFANLRTRAGRIAFSVQNMVQAWNENRIEIVTRGIDPAEQTRGMPPVLPPRDLIDPREVRDIEERTGRPFDELREERRQFEEEMREAEEVAAFAEERLQFSLFDVPDAIVTEKAERELDRGGRDQQSDLSEFMR